MITLITDPTDCPSPGSLPRTRPADGWQAPLVEDASRALLGCRESAQRLDAAGVTWEAVARWGVHPGLRLRVRR